MPRRGEVVVGESHPSDVLCVPADTSADLESKRPAGRFPCPRGIGVEDDQLVDDECGVLTQDAPRLGGVGGIDEEGYGAGASVAGERELAGAERRQDPPVRWERRFTGIESVEELVQRCGPPSPTTNRPG